MRNLLLLCVGFFAGLWWSERQKNQTFQNLVKVAAKDATSDRNRTLETMSEAYKANPHPQKQFTAIPEDQFVTYMHQLAAELVKPGMTPLEAKLVADYLGEALVNARVYDSFRELLKDQQSEKWLHEALGSEGSEGNEL